ncbi:MAG: hypothetical protein R2860_00955 [Desulfobacterales bacterium]
MPALRERKQDIPLIARHFVDLFQKEKGHFQIEISSEAMDIMARYDWPSVRELRNAIERAVVMGNGKEILPEDLPMLNAQASDPRKHWLRNDLQDAIHDFKKVYSGKTSGTPAAIRQSRRGDGHQRTYLSRLISSTSKITDYLSCSRHGSSDHLYPAPQLFALYLALPCICRGKILISYQTGSIPIKKKLNQSIALRLPAKKHRLKLRTVFGKS